MKLSTKTRYASRCLIYLATNAIEQPVSIAQISKDEQISERYLELIFSTLKKEGYIKSTRGSQGGYLLAKDIKEISIYEIIRLMETTTSIVDEQDNQDTLKRILNHEVWNPIDESIKLYLSGITIDQLCNI